MKNFSEDVRFWCQADAETLRANQLTKLNRLLQLTLSQNAFYRQHLRSDQLELQALDQLADLPLLSKHQLADLDPRGIPPHHSWPVERYCRLHRTSGTAGKPLIILDTAEDWQWWANTWQYVLEAAEVLPHDRAFMAFSFGPFIGFWSGYEAFALRGTLLIPAGGMSSAARLQLMEDTGATILCCTPTYALRLASVAREEGFELRRLKVSKIIVAGEPGGSVPAVRQQIEHLWQARVVDHAGATEIGPWGFGSPCGTGLHVIESEFIAEIIDPRTLRPVGEGEVGELVLTNLGRLGAPVIRYRTGDQVRGVRDHQLPCRFLWLEAGVLGRTDEMLIVRGVNIFPASIEAIIREAADLLEFRVRVLRSREMNDLEVELETDDESVLRTVANALQNRLGLRIQVTSIPPGTIPKSEGKARRFIDWHQ